VAIILGLAAAALITAVGLTAGVAEAANTVVLGLRDAGPVVFFTAMAVLPAVGFPLLAFTLAAGPVFAPSLGPVAVIGWSLAAIVVNLLLTYWLSQRALRPLANRLLTYFDYRMPQGNVASPWELTLIVRLMPGPPFWAQSYLLGLLRIPLLPYLAISTGVLAGFIIALVYGGNAIAEGRGRTALLAAAAVGIVAAFLQLMRKHLARRQLRSSPQPAPAQ